MTVVSNSSPIINLARIGKLELLRQLYGVVLIPDAVYQEVVAGGAGRPGAAEVLSQTWVHRQVVGNVALVALLRANLDEGESEAVALATEMKADLLLLDEQAGRAAAARLGLRCVGVLGVLLEAKAAGLVPAVKPVLDDLIIRAGFWVSGHLYASVLNAAGE